MFDGRITFDTVQAKEVINTIFDFIKDKYDKVYEYDIKMNV